MTTDHADGTDLSNRQLPDQFAERFAVVLGREEPPATLADWTSAVATFFADHGVAIALEDLCHAAETSRHHATVAGEEQSFQCVLDPLLVPFLEGADDEVAVTSRSPVADVPVELEVRRSGEGADAGAIAADAGASEADGGASGVDAGASEADGGASGVDAGATGADAGPTEVAVEPDDAVVSLGVATDGPPATELEEPLAAYGRFCPYVNAFPDRDAYEAWTSETPEAVTTAITVEEATTVARRLAEAPAGPGASD